MALGAFSILFTAISLAQAQVATLKDVLAGKSVPMEMKAGDLGEEYLAVEFTVVGGTSGIEGFGPLMMMGMAFSGAGSSDEGEADVVQRMFALWTKGDTVNVDGTNYYVAYGYNWMGLMMRGRGTPTLPETLSLRLFRVDTVTAVKPIPGLRPLLPQPLPGEVLPGRVAGKADATRSLNNLKSLAQALHLRAGDNEQVYPYVQSTVSLFAEVFPYVQDWEIMISPRAGTRYLFNMNLAGVNLTMISNPAEAPVFYESAAWPDGRRGVAFADTHVRMVPAEEWGEIEMALRNRYGRAGTKPLPTDHGFSQIPSEVRNRMQSGGG